MHPASDGMVERFNRTLEAMLAKLVDRNQRNWDKCLPLAMLAYRSAVHESTGFSPSLMMLGREIELPADLLLGKPPEEPVSGPDFVGKLQKDMWKVQTSSDNQKRYYDHRAHKITYSCGDPVWVYTPKRKKGLSPKLQMDWDDPYLIVLVLDDLRYIIQKTPNGRSQTIHHNRLKKFHGPFENWLIGGAQVTGSDGGTLGHNTQTRDPDLGEPSPETKCSRGDPPPQSQSTQRQRRALALISKRIISYHKLMLCFTLPDYR